MYKDRASLVLIAITCLLAAHANAAPIAYQGEAFFCSGTCDVFAALGGETGGSANTTNSRVTGFVDLPTAPDGSFSITTSDDVDFALNLRNPDLPFEGPLYFMQDLTTCPPPQMAGQLCNATTVNPLPVVPQTATVSGQGVIGADGVPVSGSLLFTFTVAPLSNNGAAVTLDLGTGQAEITIFSGALTMTRIDGELINADADDDGILVFEDNCADTANPDQLDTDADGIGNRCDADLNNDCIVNVLDLGELRAVFFSGNADADFNGDGVVNVLDLGVMRARFFEAPGPSGIDNLCASAP